MKPQLLSPGGRLELARCYRESLLRDVIPFWLRHGIDREQGGVLTCLDRDGSLIDSDKSIWFQGRAAWMFATLAHSPPDRLAGRDDNTVQDGREGGNGGTGEPVARDHSDRDQWLEAARSCIEFLRQHAVGPRGKMWFSVTRAGEPLRMRRYVYSESFAAIGNAAYAKASGDGRAAEDAVRHFATFLDHSFTPGLMPSKWESTRPMKGLGPLFIAIATAQELRANLGEVSMLGATCTEWIDRCLMEVERDFVKPEHAAVMECVAPDGSVLDHHEGRTLNPGHALECAWFAIREGRLRGEPRWTELGVRMVDWMWERGWDSRHGGLLYFTDLLGKPVQEYWHDMKFWWPHCEAIVATLLAWQATGETRFALRHQAVHDWSFRHFADPEHGEWFGYLHRDGSVSSQAKGTLWKGPFHLPRMLWYCHQQLGHDGAGD